MIAFVDDALFGAGTSKMTDLLALLRCAAEGGHTLVITNRKGREGEHHEFSAWFDALRNELRSEVRNMTDRTGRISTQATNFGSTPVLISTQWHARPSDSVIDLATGIRLLSTPLALLLENAVNDGAFLLRAMTPLWKQKMFEWLSEGHLVFEHGGGLGSMADIVRHFGKDGSTTKGSGLLPSLWRRRHFAIYDRDATAPSFGDQALAMHRACEEVGLRGRHHTLQRRKQENYIPKEAALAFLELHLPLEKRAAFQAEVETHFSSTDRHGDELPRVGDRPFFKNIFMENLQWQDEWFRTDGGWTELERLAESIQAAM